MQSHANATIDEKKFHSSEIPPGEPRDIYNARHTARDNAVRRWARRDELFTHLRTATFLGGVALVAASAMWPVLPNSVLLAPFIAFAACVVLHERVVRAQKRARQALDYYAQALARLDHQWMGTGNTGAAFASPEHPYALDLDLFGTGSLFELLCTARTFAGEHTLAHWLLHPATPSDIGQRHIAVAELRNRIDLREDLALLSGAMRQGLHPDTLTRWAAHPATFPGAWLRVAAATLALVNVASLAAWAFFGTGPLPFLACVIVTTLFKRPLRARIDAVAAGIALPGEQLHLLADTAERFLREPCTGDLLVGLQKQLTAEGVPATASIRRLGRYVSQFETYRNQAFWPFGYVLLWDLQFALAIENWRTRAGTRINDWLRCIGDIEALIALAGYAFDRPRDVNPEIVARDALGEGNGPVFEARGLGHPLLADAACVRNDVALGGELRALVVSGSNMSGKSTLLRTVGVNAVLALAGAPVHAESLRMSPLALGATLRVQDSLMAGTSRFYAEISRLKTILDMTQLNTPVLFLLDEVLHGTNSHDRKQGAEAVLRSLIDRGAIGLVTTHDLALAQAAEALAPRARNVHFEDRLEGDHLVFDYRMQQGVVQRSNAIALMRAVGLDV